LNYTKRMQAVKQWILFIPVKVRKRFVFNTKTNKYTPKITCHETHTGNKFVKPADSYG